MAKKSSKKRINYSKKLGRNFSRYSNLKKALVFATLFAVIGVAYLIIASAHPSPYDDARQAHLVDNPARGLVYKGLRAIKKDANHPCKGEFVAEGVEPNGVPICTHGPDPAPAGIDVTKVTPQQRLSLLARLPKTETTPDQLAVQTAPQIAAGTNDSAFTNPFAMAPLPCTSGQHRIQLVLITHDTNKTNNDFVKSLLKQTARRVESQLLYSSSHSGPGSTKRYFRFITDPTCHPTVATIVVPTRIILANFDQVTNYLNIHGYNGKYTKYLVWDFASEANFCGYSSVYADSQYSARDNAANNQTGYAVIGPSCWSSSLELHELTHALGAVSNKAPHTTGSYHCRDQYDAMCYNDGGNCIINGSSVPCGVNGLPVYISQACANSFLFWLYDCSHDDYFNSGTVSPSNYLYTHWNIANSPYMQR